ncbi:MAG: helix-turn-helix domain-containing protein [Patescibacteria group bacterium]
MNILEKIGLSANEASLYEALLKLGSANVRQIFRTTNIKRPTIYFCLERLIKIGVVNEKITKGKNVYSAVDPDELLKITRNQKADLEAREKGLLEAIPKLKNMAKAKEAAVEVRIYEGPESIWKLSDELLHDHNDFLFVYSGQTTLKHVSTEQLLLKFTKRRRQIGGSKVYAISDINPISEKRLTEGDTDFREIRILKKPITFNSIFCLCGKKIILISLQGNPKAIVIENEPIAGILGFLFWTLWESLDTPR